VNRAQVELRIVDLETLIPPSHPARAIWELTECLDLTVFSLAAKSLEGQAGRPCWPPRLLVSLWAYAYSIGVASARAIERMLAHEPGMRWLTGDRVINYHTLADFRVDHDQALEQVFTQILAALAGEGIVDFGTVLQDGTKVRTVAGRGSFHRAKTLEKRLRQARQVVRELDRRAASGGEGQDARREAAERRAARETVERMKAALDKAKQLQKQAPKAEREEVRVSDSEPDARKMKQPDGGWAPSYNVQVSTEARSRIIVAVDVCDAANDMQQLMPAVDKVAAYCGRKPERLIADNGYASRANVEQATAAGVELIAPWKDEAARQAGACKVNGVAAGFGPADFHLNRGGKTLRCPAGMTLTILKDKRHHGRDGKLFVAAESECANCRLRPQCCGDRPGPRQVLRTAETAAMRQYLARMKKSAVKALYKKRSEIAEFPHLWAKGVKKWRRFSVRGLVKARTEALWVALAYNLTQWIRIRSERSATAAA